MSLATLHKGPLYCGFALIEVYDYTVCATSRPSLPLRTLPSSTLR